MSGQPVFNQPGLASNQNSIMPHPGAMTGIPQGLEYLAAVDQLIIKQEVALLEVLAGWECKNKYKIFNSVQQQVYYAFEESDTCERYCCGSIRGFVIHITDTQQQEVLNISRDLQCGGCCWFADTCCKQPITIKDKSGHKLGTVRMVQSCCQFRFGIFDESDEFVYEIWAPCCACQCFCMTEDVNFPICNEKDKTQVGKISKVWSGYLRERFTNADTFSVLFPLDLNTKHKALMLGTVFLIDFAMFERRQNNRNSVF